MKNKVELDLVRKRFDRWANHYDLSFFYPFFKYVHFIIRRAANPKKDDKILDIGCGTGKLLSRMSRRGIGSLGKLVGVDISENMIQVAKKKTEDNIEYLVCNSSDLPFRDNYFDIVVNSVSFHHYFEQEKTLKEMNRVLKTQGKLYLADHSFSYPPGFVYIMGPFLRILEGPIKINRRGKMKRMLKDSGFSVLSARNLAIIETLYICEKNEK